MRFPHGTDVAGLFLHVNADRLRAHGVDVDLILGRMTGRIAAVTEAEMDAIRREIRRLAQTRRMMDVVEFVPA